MKNSLLKTLTAFCVLLICAISLARISMPSQIIEEHKTTDKKTAVIKTAASFRPYQDPKDLRAPFNWKKPSETKPYPKIKHLENDLTIRVSLKGNRVYVLRNGKRIYTMIASAGLFKKGKSLTPVGTFKIKNDRGDSFYNPDLNEGANNWTSWDKHNVYLFHSVPTKNNGKYNVKEAEKLGVKPASHGCVRLSVPDSRWLVEKIPAGTKVIVKNN